MALISVNSILDDIRTLYDVNYQEKDAKLRLFLRQTIDDITRCTVGMLTTKTTTLTVTSGVATFPANFETIYAIYYGTQEIKPVDAQTWLKFQQQYSIGTPYGLLQTDSSGNLTIKLTGISDGADILTVIYKMRTDDVTVIPNAYYHVTLNGLSWRYEKYEQKLDIAEYRETYNKYKDELEDLTIRSSNQDNRTNKFNFQDTWTAVLSRI